MSRIDLLLERISELWYGLILVVAESGSDCGSLYSDQECICVCRVHDHEMSERDITATDATEPFLEFCTALAAAVMHHMFQIPPDSSGKVKVGTTFSCMTI